MTTEEAIKKAIEAGFRDYPSTWDLNEYFVATSDAASQIFLDPSFWQSLGKALAWNEKVEMLPCPECDEKHLWFGKWLVEWHRFIDHLAQGKTADEFFATLS